MATKTFEELKQMAIQIRDEKTNKQNTATRIGTQMLEHLNKLEQDFLDKDTTEGKFSELEESTNTKFSELENHTITLSDNIKTVGEFLNEEAEFFIQEYVWWSYNIIFNNKIIFNKLSVKVSFDGVLRVRVVDLDQYKNLETLTFTAKSGETLIVNKSDFNFDFDNNYRNVGVFIETDKRIIGYKYENTIYGYVAIAGSDVTPSYGYSYKFDFVLEYLEKNGASANKSPLAKRVSNGLYNLTNLINIDYSEKKEVEIGETFSSSTLIDPNYYSLDITFYNYNVFKEIVIYTMSEAPFEICIIDEFTGVVLESIQRNGILNGEISVLDSDFNFDFSQNQRTIGVYVHTTTHERVIPYKRGTNKLFKVRKSTNIKDVGYIEGVLSVKIKSIQIPIPKLIKQITELQSNINTISNELNITADYDLQEYINTHSIVELNPTTYTVSKPIIIPNGTRIIGVRGKTILKLSDDATSIFTFNSSTENIQIENIIFEGKNVISPQSTSLDNIKNRIGEGTDTGIYATGYAKNVHIRNCEFRNFNLAGIHLFRTHSLYTRTFKITDCVFINNWYGLLSDVRSEYHTVIGCSMNYNQIGCFIAGGNNFMSCCHFEANAVGCVVSGTNKDNDSHGSIVGSSFNHNESFALCCIDINNGFTFDGCHIFDGDLLIDNSIGLVFVGGIIAGGINNDTPRDNSINMIHSNLFFKSYNGGTITNKLNLDLKNNRFSDGSDSSSINN